MPLVAVSNPDDNIWKENPFLELISPFKEFKKKLGEKKSSKILTAIYLIWDPKSELWDSGMTEEEVIEDINTNYLGKKDFDWSEYKYLKEAYLEKTISKAEKMVKEFHERLEERNTFLSKEKWTVAKGKDLDAMLFNTTKLLDNYLELKAKVDSEKKATLAYGGYRKSLIEEASSNG